MLAPANFLYLVGVPPFLPKLSASNAPTHPAPAVVIPLRGLKDPLSAYRANCTQVGGRVDEHSFALLGVASPDDQGILLGSFCG